MVEFVALDEELKQGVGRLSSVSVNRRHVEVIDEHDHLLSNCFGAVVLDRLLFDVFLNNRLEVRTGGLGREVDVEEGELLRVKLLEAGLNSDGLGSTRVTAEHDWVLPLDQLSKQPRVASGINGRYDNVSKAAIIGHVKGLHVALPSVEIVRLHVVEDIIQVLHGKTGNLSDEDVELFAILEDEGSTKTPCKAEEIGTLKFTGIEHGRVLI